MAESNSPKMQLNSIDWEKIGTGAGVALAGAFLTYVSAIVVQVDFGSFTPIVVCFWSIFGNAVRKWIKSNS